MAHDLAGKSVIVVGAASGIGRATALGFAQRGSHVALIDRDVEGLEETQSAIEAFDHSSMAIEADVTDHDAVAAAVHQAASSQRRIDVLAHTAGAAFVGGIAGTARKDYPTTPVSEADWDRVFSVNLMGVINSTQAAAKFMVQAGTGRIIVVSSIAGAVPRSTGAGYPVSKAAANMYARCLALELAGTGVTVNVIAPGPTETPMIDGAALSSLWIDGAAEDYRLGIPTCRLGQPEDVASAIMYLATDAARQITGAILNVDGMAQLS